MGRHGGKGGSWPGTATEAKMANRLTYSDGLRDAADLVAEAQPANKGQRLLLTTLASALRGVADEADRAGAGEATEMEDRMKFNEVLNDLAQHVTDEANEKFLIQHAAHDFKPFTCERQVITDGGSTFRVKIEFEPDPMEALMRDVARN